MNTLQNTTQPNSFKTNIIDPSGVIILAEWFSLNEHTDSERQTTALDLGHVLMARFCTACQFGQHCGGCVCCAS